jgi:uncharacterized membrane protein
MVPWLRTGFALLACVAGLTACAGAPVQEMSNARQAIKAAREAGADQVVPSTMSEAQALLERAEANLQRRAYRDARRDAIAARGKAGEALDAVRVSNRDGST